MENKARGRCCLLSYPSTLGAFWPLVRKTLAGRGTGNGRVWGAERLPPACADKTLLVTRQREPPGPFVPHDPLREERKNTGVGTILESLQLMINPLSEPQGPLRVVLQLKKSIIQPRAGRETINAHGDCLPFITS